MGIGRQVPRQVRPVKTEIRPWGHFNIVHETLMFWTKVIVINPGQSLSLQYHNYRSEFWTPLNSGLHAVIGDDELELLVGNRYDVRAGIVHRIMNPTENICTLIEVATGFPDEDDIIRLEDAYGR